MSDNRLLVRYPLVLDLEDFRVIVVLREDELDKCEEVEIITLLILFEGEIEEGS